MAILNKNELYLTRVRTVKNSPVGKIMDHANMMNMLEPVRLTDIAWAEEYLFNDKHPLGTIILLNSGEFRTYIQSMDFINNQVYRLVGRLTQEGKAIPDMPWMR